jgi:hypothetical protein
MSDRYRNALKTFVAWIFVLYCFVVLAFPAYGQEYDPRIAETVRVQSERFPVPSPGCMVVGGWEDGSIIAYCRVHTGLPMYMTHGPDASDVWMEYTGPVLDRWVERVIALVEFAQCCEEES